MISATKKFDWKAVQQRLRDAEAALDRAGVADERQLDQVYRQRLHDYANRKPRVATTAEVRRVLVFLLGARRYAVELPAVIKVFPLRQCTPVPAAAKEIVGIINVSGEIRSVVDAAELLGVTASDREWRRPGRSAAAREPRSRIASGSCGSDRNDRGRFARARGIGRRFTAAAVCRRRDARVVDCLEHAATDVAFHLSVRTCLEKGSRA